MSIFYQIGPFIVYILVLVLHVLDQAGISNAVSKLRLSKESWGNIVQIPKDGRNGCLRITVD